MRLADAVLRRGHLSEDALVEVWNTGHRPAHLDTCDICAERALDMGRWLSDLQNLGRADADAVFSDERLTAQRGSVMSRLEMLDRPAKVISFPARKPTVSDPAAGRRITPAWLGMAAAAGLMLGMAGVELIHLTPWGERPETPVVAGGPDVVSGPTAADGERFLDANFDSPTVGSLSTLDEMTPRVADMILASNR